jgi:hypothetical protein
MFVIVFAMRSRAVAWLMVLGVASLAAFSDVRAVDCMTVTRDWDSRGREGFSVLPTGDAVTRAACGSLVARFRAPDDRRRNVNISATWLEFDNPQNAAEKRYNEWISGVVSTMDFDRPINLLESEKVEDVLILGSLYRSTRLISAMYDRWLCCGAHGISAGGSINIDMASGMLVSPQDLFDLPAVASHCWRQFATLSGPINGHGDLFKEDYPMDRPFAANDFKDDPTGQPVSGPLRPSVEKTVRLFNSTLKRSSNWTFTGQGTAIAFGMLLGYVGAEFDCILDNAALQPLARPGVSVPP